MVLTKVFAYVILFIIKCRFPANKSIADIIRGRYDENTLQKVRRLEKLDYKLRKCDLDIEFLKICADNNLVPNFLKFKVTNTALKNSKAYRSCQTRLLQQELSNKRTQRRTKETELKHIKDELVRCMSLVDFTHTISLFSKSNDATLTRCKDVHMKKLYNLGYFEREKETNDPDQVIRNFSSYELSDIEKSLLAKGLNFSVPPKQLNFADYATPFEMLFKDVMNSKLAAQNLSLLKLDLKKLAFGSFKRYNFLKELNLSKPEYDALKKLASNKDLVIQKSDKGNSVVVIDRADYLARMQEIVSDTSKFEKVRVKEDKDYNFMVKENKNVDKILKSLLGLTDEERNKLSQNGPNPARLYGLPKIHKPLVDGLPKFRPIISQIGSPTYRIAKYLLSFIAPFTTNEYTVKDTFHFVSLLDGKDHRLVMASLDVESLFTNIPLDETIEIVTNKVFHQKSQVKGLSRHDFKSLLSLCTKGTVFYYNGNYYRQRDGVAMGSPLGPALANAFLCHHEATWIDECPLSYAPVFFARYVDDIFVLLRSKEHTARLAEYLSSMHANIRFTYEEESDNVLPFLDVNVYRDADKFASTVHRKVTFSGVYTNFNSFMPDTYKRGLVSTLLHRAFQITSSYISLHEEIERLKIIFAKNGYPSKFVDKCIFHFFNKIYNKRPAAEDPEPKKEFVLVLPFLGSISWKTKSTLIRSFREFVPSSKLKVVFKSSKRLSSYFKFKDSFPKSLTSGVIYSYKCAVCNHCYIGSTKRFFEKRLEEHLHISALTGNRLQGLQVFTPMQHMRSDKCSSSTMSRDEFTIIGRDENPYLLTVKESIFISTLKPQLNNNQMSVPLSLFAS